METSVPSSDADHQLALDLARQINANPRRSASRSTSKKIVLKLNSISKDSTTTRGRGRPRKVSAAPLSLPSPPTSIDESPDSPTSDTLVASQEPLKDANQLQVTETAAANISTKSPRKGRFNNQKSSTPILNSQTILAPHISQKETGEWSHATQTLEAQTPKKRRLTETSGPSSKRHAGLRSRLSFPEDASITACLPVVHVIQNADGTWSVLEDNKTVRPVRTGHKRKLSDLDYEPEAEAEIEVEPLVLDNNHRAPQTKNGPNKVAKRQMFNLQFKSVQDGKPLPYGEPPVWADRRQALCETLPYYKAYQSGIYTYNGVAYGFMVDKEVGDRDKLNDEILIARVGGGRKLDEATGQMVLSKDQNTSPFALAFTRSRDLKQPIAVIVGQGNRLSPSKMPHYYNVLDWFYVTDVWCEISGKYRCWMVRLEKILLNVKSWWAPKDSPPLNPDRDLNAFRTSTERCTVCGHSSKRIYNLGWTCLETECQAFFDFGKGVSDSMLDYNESFLKERTPYGVERSLDPLAPPLINQSDLDTFNGTGTEAICYKGIVCPQCKGCIRRRDWRQWTCETAGCSFTHTLLQKPIPVWQAIADGTAGTPELCKYEFGIRSRQMVMGRYDVYEYIIPGTEPDEVAGVISHFKSSPIINNQPDGPNDLFLQMQERDFGLQRNAARHGGTTGEILTSHFATNWGAPYKYGVSVLSRGFDEAPPVIIKAVKRLTWAGKQTLSESLDAFQPFNELLSIGYFENTDIGYHDDGESTLGPTVASLSLGAQAVMSFRPKAKSGLGPESKNAKKTKSDVLRIALDHGDIMVMHGTKIQKLYEHAVRPSGKLRFALTCRYVRPELMDNEEERRSAAVKGTLPAGHEEYDYNGQENFVEEVAKKSDALDVAKAIIRSGDLTSAQLQELTELIQSVTH